MRKGRLPRRVAGATLAVGVGLAVAASAQQALAANGTTVRGGWQVSLKDSCHDEKESCSYQDTSAAGPDDIWAVGDSVNDGSGEAALVKHWDGEEWARVGDKVDGSFSSVSVKSAHEAWFAGYTLEGDHFRPLSMRWDGTTLERVDVPKVDKDVTAEAVSVGAGGPWMVGSSDNEDNTYNDMVWRWTGDAWDEVKIPDLSPGEGGLVDVSAPADDDVWVLGDRGTEGDHYVLHWDGKAWQEQQLPDLPGSSSGKDIQSVDGVMYVVGNQTSESDPYQAKPMVQRYVDGGWRNVEAPDYGEGGTIDAVARDGDGGVWFAGSDADGRSRLDHWDGKAYEEHPGPEGDVVSLTNVPDTQELWASGGSGVDDEGYDAYVAKYTR